MAVNHEGLARREVDLLRPARKFIQRYQVITRQGGELMLGRLAHIQQINPHGVGGKSVPQFGGTDGRGHESLTKIKKTMCHL
jgi:hypothetical protein